MGLHWGRALLAPLLPDHLARQLWRIEADPYALGGHADTGLFPDAEPPPNIDGYEFVLTEKQETDFSVVDLATGDVVSSVGAVTSRRAGRRRLREFLRQGLNIEVRYDFYFVADFRVADGPSRAVRQETRIHHRRARQARLPTLRRRQHRARAHRRRR